jgi:AcrR family transcriptional regulator
VRKKARTRAEIFEAAMALFGERGFAAVTLEQICARADVARGTFFLHFPSKLALLLELDRALARELRAHFADPRSSGRSELRALVEELVEPTCARGAVLGDLLRELLAAHEPAGLRALAEDVVRRGQRRGEFRRDIPAELAALQILVLCAATSPRVAFGAGGKTPEEVRNQLLHALLHGLAEPKPRLKWTRSGVQAAR